MSDKCTEVNLSQMIMSGNSNGGLAFILSQR